MEQQRQGGAVRCPLCCDDSFDSVALLRRHLFTVNATITCPICLRVFNTVVALATHLGDHLPDDDVPSSQDSQRVTPAPAPRAVAASVATNTTGTATPDHGRANDNAAVHILDRMPAREDLKPGQIVYFCKHCASFFNSIKNHILYFHRQSPKNTLQIYYELSNVNGNSELVLVDVDTIVAACMFEETMLSLNDSPAPYPPLTQELPVPQWATEAYAPMSFPSGFEHLLEEYEAAQIESRLLGESVQERTPTVDSPASPEPETSPGRNDEEYHMPCLSPHFDAQPYLPRNLNELPNVLNDDSPPILSSSSSQLNTSNPCTPPNTSIASSAITQSTPSSPPHTSTPRASSTSFTAQSTPSSGNRTYDIPANPIATTTRVQDLSTTTKDPTKTASTTRVFSSYSSNTRLSEQEAAAEQSKIGPSDRTYYCCLHCPQIFRRLRHFDAHMRCSHYFDQDNYQFQEHQVTRVCKYERCYDPLQCPVCTQVFGTQESFDEHVRAHVSRNAPNRAPELTDVTSALPEATGLSETFQQTSTENLTAAAGQVDAPPAEGEQPIAGTSTQPQPSSETTPPQVPNRVIEEVACIVCSKGGFKSIKGIRIHMKRQHKSVIPYYCSICRAEIYSYSALAVHSRSHDWSGVLADLDIAEYPLSGQHFDTTCIICKKVLRSVKLTYRHIQAAHRRNIPFYCEPCNVEVYSFAALAMHSKAHDLISNEFPHCSGLNRSLTPMPSPDGDDTF